ncbi:hypothetical protein HAX54_012942, partial [Datura stramonium]|nr:hypothetical protein [Datura stramonium]
MVNNGDLSDLSLHERGEDESGGAIYGEHLTAFYSGELGFGLKTFLLDHLVLIKN